MTRIYEAKVSFVGGGFSLRYYNAATEKLARGKAVGVVKRLHPKREIREVTIRDMDQSVRFVPAAVRLELYQTAAAACGTVIERADPACKPLFGGGITKHPLALSTAERLATEIKNAGGEARLLKPDDTGRVLVYLSGCSFTKGDKL